MQLGIRPDNQAETSDTGFHIHGYVSDSSYKNTNRYAEEACVPWLAEYLVRAISFASRPRSWSAAQWAGGFVVGFENCRW